MHTQGMHARAADTTSVLRSFRSPDFRDLVRQALRQGWVPYQRPGGHLDVVNPANGAIVQVSTTAHTGGPVLRPKRREFERAGLVVHRRHQVASGGPNMTESHAFHELPPKVPEAAPEVESLGTHPVVNRTAHRPKGGAFALVGQAEVLTIHGVQVTVVERADGVFIARTPDVAKGKGVRTWSAGPTTGGRDAAVAKATAALAQDLAPEAPPEVVARIPESVPHTNGAASAATWAAVRVDPEDYPLAVALDNLESSIAPALVALEAAGKVDAAALIRAEVATTPVEDELLALWRSVTNRPG